VTKQPKRLVCIMAVVLKLFHQLALALDVRRTFADMPLG
jgi:hypothetical protein